MSDANRTSFDIGDSVRIIGPNTYGSGKTGRVRDIDYANPVVPLYKVSPEPLVFLGWYPFEELQYVPDPCASCEDTGIMTLTREGDMTSVPCPYCPKGQELRTKLAAKVDLRAVMSSMTIPDEKYARMALEFIANNGGRGNDTQLHAALADTFRQLVINKPHEYAEIQVLELQLLTRKDGSIGLIDAIEKGPWKRP